VTVTPAPHKDWLYSPREITQLVTYSETHTSRKMGDSIIIKHFKLIITIIIIVIIVVAYPMAVSNMDKISW